MAEKILIVVDMQKDFVNGSLGSKDAEAIVPAVVKKAKEFDGDLIFTKDTPDHLPCQAFFRISGKMPLSFHPEGIFLLPALHGPHSIDRGPAR